MFDKFHNFCVSFHSFTKLFPLLEYIFKQSTILHGIYFGSSCAAAKKRRCTKVQNKRTVKVNALDCVKSVETHRLSKWLWNTVSAILNDHSLVWNLSWTSQHTYELVWIVHKRTAYRPYLLKLLIYFLFIRMKMNEKYNRVLAAWCITSLTLSWTRTFDTNSLRFVVALRKYKQNSFYLAHRFAFKTTKNI